jgi:RNA polymerase sigma factor (sigma-70 family)
MRQKISLPPPSVLTAEQQYQSALASLPRLTQVQVQQLAERGRAGENIRDELVLALQWPVYHMARKYARQERNAEWLDLAQSATEAMLRQYPLALCKSNPAGYLLRVARGAMLDYFRGRKDSIKTYQKRDRVPLLSLDRVYADQGEEAGASRTPLLAVEAYLEAPPVREALHDLLWQAIAHLPKKQRLVFLRHYGIGTPPESLNAIGRSLSPTSRLPDPKNAHYHHKQALRTLREILAPYLQEFCTL